MKVSPTNSDNFVNKPNPNIHAVLLYGPDSGLVRLRANRLHHALIDQPKDPFRNIEIDYKKIKKDPSLLQDELHTRSLIGGRRFITITDVDATLPKPLIEILTSYKGDSFSLWIGEELPPSSSLRKTFENIDHLAAIPCYNDDSTTLKAVASQYLREHQFTISNTAIDMLSHRFSGDRMMVLSELDKLMLYKWSYKKIDTKDVEECTTQHTELSLDKLCMAVASANLPAIEYAYRMALEESASAIQMIRVLLQYFTKLHLVRAKIDAGESEQTAIAGLRPPLFFKVVPLFKQHLYLWSEKKLSANLAALNELEEQCKYKPLDPELLLSHFLILVPYRYNIRA